jgi:hypothetical protein
MTLLEQRYRAAMRRLRAAREAALDLLEMDENDSFIAMECSIKDGFCQLRDDLRTFARCHGLKIGSKVQKRKKGAGT